MISSKQQGIDYRILTALRKLMHLADIHSRQLGQRYGITTPQLVCLVTLLEYGPMNGQSLARMVHLNPSTLVGILDRLEHKGHLMRTRNGRDRRQITISLTEQGKDLARSAPPSLQDVLADALRRLTETEQLSIAESFERIVHQMEN
jgi:DNA-binding MarR family transcriptional regulator